MLSLLSTIFDFLKNKDKRKVELNIFSEFNPKPSECYIKIEITNIGNRDLNIRKCSIKLKHNKEADIYTCNQLIGQIPLVLPAQLKVDECITLYFKYNEFIWLLYDLLEQGNINKIKKIKFIVTDSLNNKYYVKSLNSIYNCIKGKPLFVED